MKLCESVYKKVRFSLVLFSFHIFLLVLKDFSVSVFINILYVSFKELEGNGKEEKGKVEPAHPKEHKGVIDDGSLDKLPDGGIFYYFY